VKPRSRSARRAPGAGVALDSDFIAYSTVKGAFAGLAIDGSVLDVRVR
jgi:lipid-binding SYLF domain-containing protein